jgi:hypothetical protein
MLFAMLWQTAAVARAGSTMDALADLEHAAKKDTITTRMGPITWTTRTLQHSTCSAIT